MTNLLVIPSPPTYAWARIKKTLADVIQEELQSMEEHKYHRIKYAKMEDSGNIPEKGQKVGKRGFAQ